MLNYNPIKERPRGKSPAVAAFADRFEAKLEKVRQQAHDDGVKFIVKRMRALEARFPQHEFRAVSLFYTFTIEYRRRDAGKHWAKLDDRLINVLYDGWRWGNHRGFSEIRTDLADFVGTMLEEVVCMLVDVSDQLRVEFGIVEVGDELTI